MSLPNNKEKAPPRWKKVLLIAWPLIIANSFWNLQMTIDRIFLGQYSTDTLGAAMAVFGIFWAPMALVQQTAAYVITFVAQLYGAGRTKEIGSSVWQSIYVGLVGGLLFLLLIPLAPVLFSWVGHSPGMQKLEIEYLQAMCWSALPTALVASASGFFTGLGKSQVILWISAVGLVSNVILDYLMIFGHFGFPAMGIAGAGLATALSAACAMVFGLWLVFRQKNQQAYLTRTSWKFDFILLKRFLRFGFPSGLQWALEGLAFTVFLVIVGRMPQGDAALAASGIAVTIMMLAVLPAFGLAQGVSVLVGQHLGENRPEEAQADTWAGLKLAGLYISLVAVTFWLIPEFYLSWFHNPHNQVLWDQVRTMAIYLLMFVGTFTIFDSMNLVFSFALKGAGDTRYVSLVALVMPWPLMVIPTYLAKDAEGSIYWAWGAASVYIILQSLIFLHRFLGGKWKTMRVINAA